MALRRGSRFPRGGVATRRRTGWEPGPEGILSPASSAVSLFPTGRTLLSDGNTLIRTRGELALILLTTSAPQSGFQVAFGMCIVSAKAAAIGATAVPGPLTEISWEGWFFHWQGTVKIAVLTEFHVEPMASVRVPIDSKAMRKTDTDETILGVLETVEVGTSTMHAELRSRQLFKLA